MLRYETVTQSQREVLQVLSKRGFFKEYYLAGGTGLSLQIGHRMSVDVDLFSADEFDPQELSILLGRDFSIEMAKKNTLIGELGGVRTSFFWFPYKMLQGFLIEDGIRLAGLGDIAAMKVNAIIGRGSKKDFVDLYAIIKHTKREIRAILQDCAGKFPGFQQLMAAKALCYFEDAQKERLQLPVFEDLPWDGIKKYFVTELSHLL